MTLEELMSEPNLCECGCGEQTKMNVKTKRPRRFLHGHHFRGGNPWNWRGGRIVTSTGYVLLNINDLPKEDQALALTMQDRRGYVREHRLVMAKHVGRTLGRDETVHHINGDKQDNRLENLEILSRSSHAGLHADLHAEVKRLRAENEELRRALAERC